MQPPHVALDRLRRKKLEVVHFGPVAQAQARQPLPEGLPLGGIEQHRFPARYILTPFLRHLHVMSGVAPDTGDVTRIDTVIGHGERVGGEHLEQRPGNRLLVFPRLVRPQSFHRQCRHPPDLLQRPLGIEVERSDGDHLVTAPLDAYRRRHPEAVGVQDAAPHCELRHIGNAGDAFVSHRLEPLDDRRGSLHRTGRDLQAFPGERVRHPGPLGGSLERRNDDSRGPSEQCVEGLDALARDLVVRLLHAERLALRIEARRVTQKNREVRLPSLRLGRRIGNDQEDALRGVTRQRRDQNGRARSGQARYIAFLSLEGKRALERAVRGQPTERGYEIGQHSAVLADPTAEGRHGQLDQREHDG